MQEHDADTPPTGRDEAGRWLPGYSGNAAGKRPGSRAWASEVRDMLREKSAVHVLSALHKQAMLGNVRAAEVLLSYVLPPHRPGDDTEPIEAGPTLGERASAVVDMMVKGTIGPAQAQDMLQAIQAAAAVAEVEMLRQKLDSMEAAIAAGQHGLNP